MPNVSIADLIEALQHYQLLSPEQIAEVARRQNDFVSAAALTEELVRCGWLTAFQAELLLLGRGQDLVLGSYLLLEPRGEGGMGKVFKAYHRIMRRPVALKVIRRDFARSFEVGCGFFALVSDPGLAPGRGAAKPFGTNDLGITDSPGSCGLRMRPSFVGTDCSQRPSW